MKFKKKWKRSNQTSANLNCYLKTGCLRPDLKGLQIWPHLHRQAKQDEHKSYDLPGEKSGVSGVQTSLRFSDRVFIPIQMLFQSSRTLKLGCLVLINLPSCPVYVSAGVRLWKPNEDFIFPITKSPLHPHRTQILSPAAPTTDMALAGPPPPEEAAHCSSCPSSSSR